MNKAADDYHRLSTKTRDLLLKNCRLTIRNLDYVVALAFGATQTILKEYLYVKRFKSLQISSKNVQKKAGLTSVK